MEASILKSQLIPTFYFHLFSLNAFTSGIIYDQHNYEVGRRYYPPHLMEEETETLREVR